MLTFIKTNFHPAQDAAANYLTSKLLGLAGYLATKTSSFASFVAGKKPKNKLRKTADCFLHAQNRRVEGIEAASGEEEGAGTEEGGGFIDKNGGRHMPSVERVYGGGNMMIERPVGTSSPELWDVVSKINRPKPRGYNAFTHTFDNEPTNKTEESQHGEQNKKSLSFMTLLIILSALVSLALILRELTT